MSEAWKAKRFWTDTQVKPAEGGYTVALDDRPLRTPQKAPLVLPTQALAEAVAAEWAAQEDEIRPEAMPFTRTSNSAIDKVAVQHDEVADLLAAYGETDLVCYRAEGPEGLVARQAEAWDPVLDWAEQTLDVRLVPVTGIIPAPQDPAALDRLSTLTHAFGAFELAAFHDLVSLSGSLLLGFATVRGGKTPDEFWDLSRIDEQWQEDQWGADAEATEHSLLKKQAFLHAARFFSLL